MKAFLARLPATSALLVWGTILCYFPLSGRVASYLHPYFHVPVLLSGGVLVFLGFLIFLYGGVGVCGCPDPNCPEIPPSKVRSSFSWFVLVIPPVVAMFVSPSQFGATAIWNRGLVHSIDQIPSAGTFAPFREPPLPMQDGSIPEWSTDPGMDVGSYLARTDDGRILAETLDLLFAAQEEPIRKDFENQDVEILGQYLPERQGTPGEDRFNLVRVFVLCCAADARPVGIVVETKQPVDFPEMTWLIVRGKATFPVEGGRRIPVIVADSIEETDPPASTFLY